MTTIVKCRLTRCLCWSPSQLHIFVSIWIVPFIRSRISNCVCIVRTNFRRFFVRTKHDAKLFIVLVIYKGFLLHLEMIFYSSAKLFDSMCVVCGPSEFTSQRWQSDIMTKHFVPCSIWTLFGRAAYGNFWSQGIPGCVHPVEHISSSRTALQSGYGVARYAHSTHTQHTQTHTLKHNN